MEVLKKKRKAGEKRTDAYQRTEAKDLKTGRHQVSQNFFRNP